MGLEGIIGSGGCRAIEDFMNFGKIDILIQKLLCFLQEQLKKVLNHIEQGNKQKYFVYYPKGAEHQMLDRVDQEAEM